MLVFVITLIDKLSINRANIGQANFTLCKEILLNESRMT